MNQKELKELIEFLIEKDIAEFELERGDVKVKIKRAAEPRPCVAGLALSCGSAMPLRRFRLRLPRPAGLIWPARRGSART
jgi:biotin carboxyl carrier protein